MALYATSSLLSSPYCSLVEQESITPCVFNVSFGCDAGREHVWAKDGCRAVFACGESARVSCGGYRNQCSCRARPHAASTRRGKSSRVHHPPSMAATLGIVRPCSGSPRVWLGTQTHAADLASWAKLRASVMQLLVAKPNIVVRATINLWGASSAAASLPPDAKNQSGASWELQVVRLDGARSYYWHRVFTPSAIADVDFVWLTDSDLEFAPAVFPLRDFLHVALVTGVSVIQPTITSMDEPQCSHEQRKAPGGCDSLSIHLKAGTRATDWPHLRSGRWFGKCMVEMAYGVEAMSLFFRAAAWSAIHQSVLEPVPLHVLRATSFGISNTYCEHLRHAFPGRRPCAVTRQYTMVHADTRDMDVHNLTIERRSPVGRTGWPRFSPPLPFFLRYCLSAANLTALEAEYEATPCTGRGEQR